MSIRWLLPALAACGPVVDVTTDPLVPLESGVYDLTHEGLDRRFRLTVPDSAQPGSPLVIVMHGYGGSAKSIQDYSAMDDLAQAEGFVAVYPQGVEDQDGSRFWQVGYTFHAEQTVDDVSFMRALVDHLETSVGVDRDAVFATGMSNGGDMSFLLACEASDLVRAVAPVAGTMMANTLATCAPTAPPPILAINGTDDDVTFYDGDPTNSGGWGAYADIPGVIDFWVGAHGLDQSETTTLEDLDQGDGSVVFFERHWGASTDAEVWLYRVEGGGHDWPGPWGNGDIDASTEAWNFFAGYLD